jgi:hypothetical protein
MAKAPIRDAGRLVLLPMHLAALTSNVTAVLHPLSGVRRTANSLYSTDRGGGKQRAGNAKNIHERKAPNKVASNAAEHSADYSRDL